jgi:hypothetical protein
MNDLPSASTGEPTLDLTLATPRLVSPDTPDDIVKEISKYKCFASFRAAMKKMKLENRQRVTAAIVRVCQENRILEDVLEPETLSLLPEARIPVDLVFELEAQEKDSWNPEMREDTLRCYPGLRINPKISTMKRIKT